MLNKNEEAQNSEGGRKGKIKKYLELKLEEKKIKDELDNLKFEFVTIFDIQGEFEEEYEGRKVVVSESKGRVTFDGIKFKKDDPDTYEKYLKTGKSIKSIKISEIME